jgi:hypothetical protein
MTAEGLKGLPVPLPLKTAASFESGGFFTSGQHFVT